MEEGGSGVSECGEDGDQELECFLDGHKGEKGCGGYCDGIPRWNRSRTLVEV